MDQRHIAIQLSNDLDYSRIFARRVYYILGCQMRLLKWSPDFDVREESPIVPVWISFPNLRLHFFYNQVLFALALIFGRLLQTDQATFAISRPSVARVLVELDVTKKHRREVWIGSEINGYFQRVEFENLPIFYVHYKMHGHSMSECFILHPSLRKQKGNVQNSEVVNAVSNIILEGVNAVLDNPSPSHVAEEINRTVGGVDGYSGTQVDSIDGFEGDKEIVDEQMLAVLKHDMNAERVLEEGELVGSPQHVPVSSNADSMEHSQKEQEISGRVLDFCWFKFLGWGWRGFFWAVLFLGCLFVGSGVGLHLGGWGEAFDPGSSFQILGGGCALFRLGSLGVVVLKCGFSEELFLRAGLLNGNSFSTVVFGFGRNSNGCWLGFSWHFSLYLWLLEVAVWMVFRCGTAPNFVRWMEMLGLGSGEIFGASMPYNGLIIKNIFPSTGHFQHHPRIAPSTSLGLCPSCSFGQFWGSFPADLLHIGGFWEGIFLSPSLSRVWLPHLFLLRPFTAGMAVRRVGDPGFLNGSFKSRSFVDALSGSSSSGCFPELRQCSFCGMPLLWISEEEIISLSIPFQFALVGFFLTSRPSLDVIRKFFFNLKLHTEFSVTVLDQSHVLIKLSNDLDYSRVFCHRSYLVNNCFMKLTKWSPLLDVDVESPVILIWGSFPNLRPHLFSPRILHALGSTFGRPLKVDNATSVGSRPSLTQVLMELEISKNYPKQIWLGPEKSGYIQRVQMEVFPAFCVWCKRLGHLRGECSSASLSDPLTHVNHVLSVGKANSNALVVSSLVVNEERAEGILCIVGLPVDTIVPVNVLGVSSLAVNEVEVAGDPNEVGLPVDTSVVLGVGCDVGSVALAPMGTAVSVTEFLHVGGVNEESCNLVVNVVASGLKEGTCIKLGNMGIDSTIFNVGAMCHSTCLDNHVSTPSRSLTNVNADDEEEFCLVSLRPVSLDGVVILDSNPLGQVVICDALDTKGVEVSNGVRTEVEVVVSPLVNLPVPSTFVDIPISVVSNAELKAHLALSVNNSYVDHSDWLNLIDGDVDEIANDFQNAQDMYNLMAGRVVDHDVSSGGGKKSKRKFKKK
ncbi:hypothetical protein M5K25_020954 [Dendrobium thyrsiflorum]|uniref:DUF4283 domain-containing protein n=1 Tax=Dendrobium thyrsiflorum TaxID=117978 RepID=A0ABD0UI57_DENTH